MINAAVKVFAFNGYDRASTDTIIKEADISKGLLFHYFGSKKNLYQFVVEYCARYMIMELSAGIDETERNLFERVKMVESLKIRMLLKYPWLDVFLISIKGEASPEVIECARRWDREIEETYIRLVNEIADEGLIRGNLSIDKALEIVRLCMDGHKRKCYMRGDKPEAVLESFLPYLDIMRVNFTR